jgi:uncharacterized membrane protein
MVNALIVGTVLWPMILGGALALRVSGAAPLVSTGVYVAASRVCHQRDERSFHTAGARWPVCGRCSGLYLGGAVGALVAAIGLRRPRGASSRRLGPLAIVAVPTAITFVLEWTGLAPVSNLARSITAVPLGALVAIMLVETAAGRRAGIR